MTLKYKCLILDHDDTAVDSTASIHYPAHREIMRRIRPGSVPISLEGWFKKNFDAEKRKPNPYPVKQILEQFDLRADEVLIVDDLKPGLEMAEASGVSIAAAGWGHQISEIRTYMEANCLTYLTGIDEMRELVLGSTDF